MVRRSTRFRVTRWSVQRRTALLRYPRKMDRRKCAHYHTAHTKPSTGGTANDRAICLAISEHVCFNRRPR